jgi:hypothetical protein
VYPPLIVSPAVNVPVPVGMSPFHSALPFAGIVVSSSVAVAVLRLRREQLGLHALAGLSPSRSALGDIPMK